MTPSFGMKLGGLVPRYAPTIADLPDLAVQFERMGADDVVHGEHVMFAERMNHPGEAAAGHGRTGRRSDVPDLLTLLTVIAARTTTLKLCTGVLLAAAHPFALLAKQASTLDIMSGGRLVLGVGSGWFEDEFTAMGIPYRERFARMEEVVAACRVLWRDDSASYDGKWVHFDRMTSEPAPLTAGGPPVWWGGKGTAATARRVATMGDGWIAAQAVEYDELARSLEVVRGACEAAGRDWSTIGVRATLPRLPGSPPYSAQQVIEHACAAAERMTALGVTHYTVPVDLYALPLDDTAALLDALKRS